MSTIEQPRSKRIGSADIAALIGLPEAFGSPYSVWYAKTHGHEIEETEAMRWGKRLEPLILEEYGLSESAGQIISTQAHHTYRKWPVASATLDAVAIVGDNPIVVEAKTTRDFAWKEVPANYLAQVQWQMGIAGLTEAHVAVLFKPTTKLVVFPVDFDENVFGGMVEIARKFWVDHVEAGVPPEVDGHFATSEVLKSWEATDQVAEIDHVKGDLLEIGRVKAAIKQLEGSVEHMTNCVKAALGECSVGLIEGTEAVTWKARKSTRFDQKKFSEDHPDLAAKYKITSSYRALVIKRAFQPTEEGDA